MNSNQLANIIKSNIIQHNIIPDIKALNLLYSASV